MSEKTNKYLIIAVILGVVFHGTSMFFTLESTYDALIHVFFANHYSNSWFEPWNYSWYTGFTVMGYPPLVHQSIALLSNIGGLKFGMFAVAIIGVILFITGVYRFSFLLLGNKKAAGFAAIMCVFSSSFAETLHLFGQLPSIIGIAVLLHSLPEVYLWIKTGRYRHLFTALSLLAVTVVSHHVTPIFGMVFFIFPVIGLVLMDACREKVKSNKEITFRIFIQQFTTHFKRIIAYGLGTLILIIGCILPYWINTKNNPITQVPIPHGSRDNFLEVTSSGLIFFIVPWGILLLLLPYFFYRFYSKRFLFFGLSFTILTILGTGGTTSIPLKILGENAFNILTLDRFTLWATIMALPLFGEFIYRFVDGDLKAYLHGKLGKVSHRFLVGALVSTIIFITIFTMSLGYFRPSQPQKIKMLPIVNFLNQDQHDKWRYLPLGFGDQMAWLSTQTKAMTVDGNYHSARRLPELTSRAVERLENSKFRGIEGIGSLQQFLTVPEKYHLKYVFSNDKFYDPILYFTGWHRLQQLENGIMVWERAGVSPLPSVLPRENVPLYQKLLWGIIPLLSLVISILLILALNWKKTFNNKNSDSQLLHKFSLDYNNFSKGVVTTLFLWVSLVLCLFCFGFYTFYLNNASQISPTNAVKTYYDALDFKEFEKAYSLINPNNDKGIDQYMLEISVSDGLLSSYARLDAINVITLSQNDSVAKVEVVSDWITPLKKFTKTYFHDLSKIKNEWFIEASDIDLDIPPDQLFSENKTVYYNHGRRRVTAGQTYHEDVLKQPVVEILSARLIKIDSSFMIVGDLQNVDNVPADIAIKGTLYNSENRDLASYNAMDVLKHKLMPKERTSFRVNFEKTAWSSSADTIPKTFNPEEFTGADIFDTPVTFDLQVEANVAITDLYDALSVQDLSIKQGKLIGSLFNTGIQNGTIPQLLISYYDLNKKLIWVDKKYIEESVRPQRKTKFEINIENTLNVNSVFDSLENTYVNGLLNEEISDKLVPNRNSFHHESELIEINGTQFKYMSIKVNTYLGNPK